MQQQQQSSMNLGEARGDISSLPCLCAGILMDPCINEYICLCRTHASVYNTIDMLTSGSAGNTCAADMARASLARDQWPARTRLAQGAMLCVLGLLGATPAACAAQATPLLAAEANANLKSTAALPELIRGGGGAAVIAEDAQEQLWVDDASSSGDRGDAPWYLTSVAAKGCAPTKDVSPYVIQPRKASAP